MSATKSSKTLVRVTSPIHSSADAAQDAGSRIASLLLEELSVADSTVCEASVHRGKRSLIWIASFTGPDGGQTWRTTSLTNRNRALLLARRWESEARALRMAAGRTSTKPFMRTGRNEPGALGTLTQREVALLLNISVRAVRLLERRAFQKLFNHPVLRRAWRQYLAGELDEGRENMTPEEISALFNLTRSTRERSVMEKAIRLVRG